MARAPVLALLLGALLLLPPGLGHGDAPPMGRATLREVHDAALAGYVHAGSLGNASVQVSRLEMSGPGACWLDVDQDGLLDLFVVNGRYVTQPELNARLPRSMLFRGLGSGFADATDASGAGLEGQHLGCAAGDYDNDGWPDLYVTGYGGGALLHNAQGVLTDVADDAGVRDATCGAWLCLGMSADWLDYDRDGCLDLFVDHYGRLDLNDPQGALYQQENRLYRGDCRGQFQDRTLAANLTQVLPSYSSVASDLDNDGWPDLYVSNDGQPNDVYLNNGDGTFREADNEARDVRNGMGTAVGDFDHDGRMDIVTTNWLQTTNGIFRARSDGGYDDLGTQDVFLDAFPYSGWAARWLDVNNDGHQDLAVVNGMTSDDGTIEVAEPMLLYENLADGTFQRQADDVGLDFQRPLVARSAAWADYDDDGSMDVAVTEAGEAPVHLFREDPRLHAGLARAEEASLEVRWPDGSAETFAGVRANSVVRIVQGQGLTYVQQLPLARITAPSLVHRLDPATLHVEGVRGTHVAQADWSFEDGGAAQGAQVEHRFTDVGTVRARVAVQDAGRAKVALAPVQVWDELRAAIAPDQATFLPTERAQGTVRVSFSDGAPVRDAHVQLTVTYGSGIPELDQAVQLLPRAARTALGYVSFAIEGRTDAQGGMRFDVPFNQPRPSDLVPFDGLNMPGIYTVVAHGGARGSAFPDAAQSYAVGVRLPQ
ncbi:MAG: FG-GAP-like repeat-containing protein [Halobacteriales archaeon]|nr:FG-GAP-like repeat-containing protein [Halobacteriales archaeon]